MSAGRNLLKKQKETKGGDRQLERDAKEFERRERENERVRAQGKHSSLPAQRAPGAAVFASKVVVPVIEPTKSSANGNGGGWGFSLFSSGDKVKEKVKEKEREKEKERKKLSKRR